MLVCRAKLHSLAARNWLVGHLKFMENGLLLLKNQRIFELGEMSGIASSFTQQWNITTLWTYTGMSGDIVTSKYILEIIPQILNAQ